MNTPNLIMISVCRSAGFSLTSLLNSLLWRIITPDTLATITNTGLKGLYVKFIKFYHKLYLKHGQGIGILISNK